MKNTLLLSLICCLAFMVSCDKEDPDDHDHDHSTELEYHAHIHSPNTDDRHVNGELPIHVNFDSMTGQTVHHVKVRIYNSATNAEVYNQPETAHVHEEDGAYEYMDTFVLSNANGVEAHTDWILEAKVWGHEAGEGEVIQTVAFHVHPE